MKLIDGASLELSTLLSKKKKISIYAIFRSLGYFFAESLKIRSFFKYILLSFFHNFIYISCLTYVNRFIDIFPPFQPWRSFVQKSKLMLWNNFSFIFFTINFFVLQSTATMNCHDVCVSVWEKRETPSSVQLGCDREAIFYATNNHGTWGCNFTPSFLPSKTI